MSRTPWQLYDPVTTEEYSWPVNPNTDNGSHNVTRQTGYEVYVGMRQTASGDDRIDSIVFVTGDGPSRFSYSGFVYDQSQLESLEGWANKDYDVILTDDLGRQFSVIIDKFELERVRSNKKPYKHSYTFSGFILSEIEE